MRTERSKVQGDPPFVSRQVREARRFYLDLSPPAKTPLAVVCGGVERMRPDYSIVRTDFPYLAIEFVSEGEGALELNGQRYQLAPGVVFAYGPGVKHTIENRANSLMRKYYLDFVGKEAAGLLKNTGLDQWRPVHIAALHELVDLFELLFREAREDSPVAKKLCETLLRLILLKIEQRSIKDARPFSRAFDTYAAIKKCIDDNFVSVHSIEEVAAKCHVTPIYASRLFQRFGHTGAYQYLLRQKLNYAAELLIDERLLVKQVAAKLGFADPFQFSRAFKRVYGISPSQLLGAYGGRP